MNTKIEKSSKKIPWLAGLFGVQVVLAVVLFNVQNTQTIAQNEPLLAFDRAALDKIEIIAPDGKINLQKKDGRWQLGEGLPVLETRMEELLNELSGLRTGWAVATSSDAAKRFEVTDEKFRRKIHVHQGGKEVGSLILGTSPSFRHAHVRKPNASEIYSVKMDEFSLPVENDSWMDNQLLQPKGDITALQFGDQRVEKISGQWPAKPEVVAAAEASVDSEEASAANDAEATPQTTGFDSSAFAKALSELAVLGLATNQAELDAPTTSDANNQGDSQLLKIEWKVTTSEGELDYQLLSKNDEYYIRRGDIDHTFKLSKSQYNALAKIQELRQS
jgi:hypothetical protein